MDPTVLDLLVAYVEVFVGLFAAAGNSVLGVVVSIIGVIATLLLGTTAG